jgi:hypothetical protein
MVDQAYIKISSILQGASTKVDDWGPLLKIANANLLVPEIYIKLNSLNEPIAVDDDVNEYLKLIYLLNSERNGRLRLQIVELCAALNRCDVIPLLTKGAARLFLEAESESAGRMMRDVDITVDLEDLDKAKSCVSRLGYKSFGHLGALGFYRSNDVAALDLHYPPGRFPEYWPDQAVRREHIHTIEVNSVKFKVPSSTLTVSQAVIHSMIKDGLWWSGNIDLRAIFEVYRQTITPGGVDWDLIYYLMNNSLGRKVLRSFLKDLEFLFRVPDPLAARPCQTIAELQHRRRMLQTNRSAAVLMRPLGSLAWIARAAQVKWQTSDNFVHFASRGFGRLRRYTADTN